jgi:hypothetical protein
MSKVFIYCDGGFGNRFNSLISGLFLAKACDREPLIIWPKTRWAEASFIDIFDSNLKEYTKFDKETFFQEFDPINLVHWNPWGANQEQHNCMGIYMGIDRFLHGREDRNVMFYTSIICPWVDIHGLKPIFDQVPFQKYLLDEASDFVNQHFGNNEFYGLHVRRTDHAYQLDEEAFIAQMKDNPTNLYFVCSDDAQAENKFSSSSSNIKTYPKKSYVELLDPNGGWNTMTKDEYGHQFPFNVKRSKESVVEAMVDLLILSRSTVINTDHRSTFLQTALLLKKYNIV